MRLWRHVLLGSAAAWLLTCAHAQAPADSSANSKEPSAYSSSSPSNPPPAPAPVPRAPAAAPVPTPADLDDLYEYGRQLFDDYAPASVREQYEFVSQEQWNAFTARLQTSLAAGSVEDLAALEGDARRTLAGLRMMPAFTEYADWLAERLDLMETARLATRTPVPPRLVPPPVIDPSMPDVSKTPPPTVAFAPPPRSPVPFYDIWFERLRTRPRPARADELMPVLKVIFAAEGLPTELVWLAEVESSLNPSARSPAGARGLFQLMPATARAFGLSTFPFDERTQPGKNARAAAKFLRVLHQRFDSWPLALAAFNAGEGRIANAQKKAGAKAYADIADLLPAETRMYVPKVLAMLAVREKDISAALRVPLTPTPVSQRGDNPFFPAALVSDP
jgi:membrane-bound lytic murein transglycosylase D